MKIDTVKQLTIKAWARAQNYGHAWKSPDKILVIESDDWGSIHTSSRRAYHELIQRGYAMDRSCWSIDALETDDDLVALYEVLDSFRDKRNCPACITANMVMANPDFEAIRASNYARYRYELASTTLKTSRLRQNVSSLWQKGMESKLFRPQFHAREHIQYWRWMQALQKHSAEALETFELGMSDVPLAVSKESKGEQESLQSPYADPLITDYPDIDLSTIIAEGIKLFQDQFGCKSLSTIAPNCAWTDEIEKIWAKHGVKYIQGGYCQRSILHTKGYLIPHYLGEKSRYNGWYLVRNCTFEPSRGQEKFSWQGCLSQIEKAFRRKTPAIVSSHRVNFVGSIIDSNRTNGLNQLKKLLSEVMTRWPDVLFLSSPELGYMIEHNLQNVRYIQGKEGEIFPACL